MHPSWLQRRDRREPLLAAQVRGFAAIWALTVVCAVAAVALAELATDSYRGQAHAAAGPSSEVQVELGRLRRLLATQSSAAVAYARTGDGTLLATYSAQSHASDSARRRLTRAAAALGSPSQGDVRRLTADITSWRVDTGRALERPSGLDPAAVSTSALSLDHRLARLQARTAASVPGGAPLTRARVLLVAAVAAILLLLLSGVRVLQRTGRMARVTDQRRERQTRWSAQVEAVLAWSADAKTATTRSQLMGLVQRVPANALGAACLAVGEGGPPPHRSHGLPRFTIEVDDAGEGLHLTLCFEPGRGDELDHHALSILIGHLSAHWRAVLRQEELERAAGHDPLTGLANRRLFDAELRRREAVHARRGLPFALAIVDLDHFKTVNDVLGHPVGDSVLQRTAEAMDACLRASDRVFRLGGEEFALLLETGDIEGVAELLERIREAIEALDVEPKEGQRLSASIGWAVYPEDARERSELVAVADAALYAAKRAGRNRVIRGGAEPLAA
jgi:diguanylate cyclase (GGDEF)-like protein